MIVNYDNYKLLYKYIIYIYFINLYWGGSYLGDRDIFSPLPLFFRNKKKVLYLSFLEQ